MDLDPRLDQCWGAKMDLNRCYLDCYYWHWDYCCCYCCCSRCWKNCPKRCWWVFVVGKLLDEPDGSPAVKTHFESVLFASLTLSSMDDDDGVSSHAWPDSLLSWSSLYCPDSRLDGMSHTKRWRGREGRKKRKDREFVLGKEKQKTDATTGRLSGTS